MQAERIAEALAQTGNVFLAILYLSDARIGWMCSGPTMPRCGRDGTR